MATLLSISDGNFTSSSTWKVVDATSFLDAVGAANGSAVSGVNSNAFTPGAITVEGVALQVRNRSSSIGGTVTVSLWNTTANALVTGTEVTINVSDLPDTYDLINARGMGWVYFKFASPVTLLAATNYAVRLSSSIANSVAVYSGGGNNWSRALVTSTTAAPASTDTLIITGEHTSAGVNATRTVTMNNTNSTAFGQTYVSVKGTLSYGTSSSTAYNLRLTGNLFVTSDGTLNIGTSGTPIPNNSTAVLEFNVSSTGQYGLNVAGGTFNAYGQAKTNYVRLAADAAVAATSLTLSSVPTNWLSGDTIGITGTTTTATQAEVRTLSANVTTTTATVSSGLTNAHGGNSTTLVQAHVTNLTRNVIIRSVSATLPAYSTYNGTNSTSNIFNVLFSMMGSTAATTAAIGYFTTLSRNSSITVTNCVVYQATPAASGFGISSQSSTLTSPISYTITDNVVWGLIGVGISNNGNSAYTTKNLSGNLVVRSAAFTLQDITANSDNCVIANSTTTGNPAAATIAFNTSSSPYPTGTISVFTNLETYGNAGSGFSLNHTNTSQATGKVTINANNITSWRNASSGFNFGAVEFNNSLGVIILDNAKSFGSAVSAVAINSISNCTAIFKNSTFWAGTTQVSPTGISGVQLTLPNRNESVLFTDCIFGKDHLGNTSSFSTSVISLVNFRGSSNVFLYNPTTTGTLISRNTAYSNSSGYSPGVIIQKLNGTTGSDFVYTNTSTISLDSSIFRTSSPSTRLAPVNAIGALVPSSTVRIPIKSGQTSTVSVWVRKSTLGDGTAYDGGQPTLVMRPNLAMANLDNTTVATMTASAGTWEQLTYTTGTAAYDTTLEFIVVCDGSAGWVNIDEWSTTSSNDSRNDFIQSSVIGQYVEADFSPSVPMDSVGVSYTFIS